MKTFELTDRDGNTIAVVKIEESKPWIYVQWFGGLKVDEMKRVMTNYVNFLKETNCPFVLSDRRLSHGNLFELSRFIENKWASEAVEAGLKCIANINGPDATTKFTTNDLESRILGFEFKSFESLEEAEQWLMERATQTQH